MLAVAQHSLWFVVAIIFFGLAAILRVIAKPVAIDAVLVAAGLAVLAAGFYFGLPVG